MCRKCSFPMFDLAPLGRENKYNKRIHLEAHKLYNLVRFDQTTKFSTRALCSHTHDLNNAAMRKRVKQKAIKTNSLQFPADLVCVLYKLQLGKLFFTSLHVATDGQRLCSFFSISISLVRVVSLRSNLSSHANVLDISFLSFFLWRHTYGFRRIMRSVASEPRCNNEPNPSRTCSFAAFTSSDCGGPVETSSSTLKR